MDGLMDGWLADGWLDGGCIDGRWMDGGCENMDELWMEGLMNEWEMDPSICHPTIYHSICHLLIVHS